MDKIKICVDHFNYLIQIEDIATQIDLGCIEVQREHDDQCRLVDIVNQWAPEDQIETIVDHANV